MPKIIFTAAGSGGHVITAISVLEELREKYPGIYKECLFIGTYLLMEGEKNKPSFEERICNDLNIPFKRIRSGKLQRQLSLNSIKLLIGSIMGFIDTFIYFLRNRPKLIVSFGGYASLPISLIGKLFGAKLIIHEQTVTVGLTNKIIATFADLILLSFEDSKPHFKDQSKIRVIGRPMRKILTNSRKFSDIEPSICSQNKQSIYPPEYIAELKALEERTTPLIFVSGGGQGSHLINRTLLEIADELTQKYTLVIHTGDNQILKDYDKFIELKITLPDDQQRRLIVRKFIYDEMGYIYSNATIYIGRGGACSVYEVAVFKIPSIIIPIPWVAFNEQFANAKKLENTGLGTILNESELTSASLLKAIESKLAELSNSRRESRIKTELIERLYPKNAREEMAKIVSNYFSS